MHYKFENTFYNLQIFVLIIGISLCCTELSNTDTQSSVQNADSTRDKRDLNRILLSENENPSSLVDSRADESELSSPKEISDTAKESDSEEDLRTRLQSLLDDRSNEDLKLAKRTRYFLGKRYLSPDEVQKRLRLFLGKRNVDTEKRMRYFVGKRDGDDENVDKRMRYFVGKRSEDDDLSDYVNKRMRYFVGKRMRYFLGKRDGSYLQSGLGMNENNPDKRMRYFVGKRQRYFLGRR